MYRLEGVTEIPVTAFELKEYTSLLYWKAPSLSRIRKVDVDWADFVQIRTAMEQLVAMGVPTITLFLHSHSFLNPPKDRSLKDTRPDRVDIEEFEKVLAFVTGDKRFKIVTVGELHGGLLSGELVLDNRFDLPVVEERISLLQYTRKLMGINGENVAYFAVALLCLVGVSPAFLVLYVRKLNADR
jgi:hypothetical protein